MNIHVHTADGIATICGDVILRFQRPDRDALQRDPGAEPRTTGNHGIQQAGGKGRDQKLLSSSRLICCRCTTGAKIEGGTVVGRLHDQVPGPVVQSLPQRNWFPRNARTRPMTHVTLRSSSKS